MNDDDERTQQNFCGGNLHEFRLVYKKFTWISIEDKRSQQNDSDVIIYVTDGSELFKGEFNFKLYLKDSPNVFSNL